jgi:hypothetical protein
MTRSHYKGTRTQSDTLREGARITRGQEEASTLQCPCAHDLLCEVRRLGERLGALAFFDNEPTSETYGERVENCPGCGEHLEFLMLLLKNLRR